MKLETKIVIVGVAALPAMFVLGVGIEGTKMIIQDELNNKKKNPKKSTLGPKPEKIKTPWIRKKVHDKFEDIISKY